MFSTQRPLTKPASKRSSDSDRTATNLRQDAEPPMTFHEHPLTKSYEDDTNITYIDEDTYDDEPRLNYHPMKNEIPARSPLWNEKFVGRNAKNSGRKSYQKSEYSTEMKLLKKMLTLLEKYKSLNLDKNDVSLKKHNGERFLLSSRKPTQTVIKDNNSEGIPAEKKITNPKKGNRRKENRYTSSQPFPKVKNPVSSNLNKKNGERNDTLNANGVNAMMNTQNARPTAFLKQPTVPVTPNTTTYETQNRKHVNVSQTTLHHTKVTNKDSILEILNKVPSNDSSTVSKPKVIHSKAEAIGEIFKALGSNNRIVKDANGLYLISGENVKIIHRTHGSQVQSNIFGSTKREEQLSKTSRKNEAPQLKNKNKPTVALAPRKEINLSKKANERKESFQKSPRHFNQVKMNLENTRYGKIRPIPKTDASNPMTSQLKLSGNVINDKGKKFGLDLSNYNLRDLEYKFRNQSKKERYTKFKTAHNFKSIVKTQGYGKDRKNTKRVFPLNLNPYTKEGNLNDTNTHGMLNDSYTNAVLPTEVNNEGTDPKENNNAYLTVENVYEKKEKQWHTLNDSYTVTAMPIKENNTELPTKEKQKLRETFTDFYTNSTVPSEANNAEFLRKGNDNPYRNTETKNPIQWEMNNADSNNTGSLNGSSTFTDYVSNIITFPENESVLHDYSINKSLSFGMSTPSLGTTLSDKHQSEHTTLPKSVGQTGLNSSQTSGDNVDNSSIEMGGITSKNFQRPFNLSSNTDTSHVIYPVNKKATFQNKSSDTDRKSSDVYTEVIDEAEGDSIVGSYKTAVDVSQNSENVEVIDEGESSQPPVKITPQDLSSALHEKFGAGIDRNSSKNNWIADTSNRLSGTTEVSSTNQSITPKVDSISLDKTGNGGEDSDIFWKPSVKTASENITAPGKDNLTINSSINKKAKSPDITQPIKKPKWDMPAPTWSMDVLGTVDKPQGSTWTRKHESSINTNDMTGNKEYSLRINKYNREHEGILSGDEDHQGAANDNTTIQGTIKDAKHDKDRSLLEVSSRNRGAQTTSTNNVGKPGDTVPNMSHEEPMIPTRFVDALLWNLFLKSQGRNTKSFTITDGKTKHLKKKYDSNFPEQEFENKKADGEVIKDNKQKGGPYNVKKENTNLDNLLDKFVHLLSRRMKAIKGKKQKQKRKPNISKTLPRVKYEEKLLWDEQRKLEHQLAAEQKLLEESKLGENALTGKVSDTDSEQNKKLEEMNKEKDFLLNKLKMLQDKYKIYRNDEYKGKLMKSDEETELTEVYDSPNKMNEAYVDNDVNDGDFNKELTAYSELKQVDEELKHLLAEYEATIGTTNREVTKASEGDARAPEGVEGHTNRNSLSGPEPHIELDDDFIENAKHGLAGLQKSYRAPESNSYKVNIGTLRDPDRIPSSIDDKLEGIKAFTAKESEDGSHITTEYPTYQYDHTRQHETEDPTSSVPSYPTPSFINKEADFASDTAGKFEDLSKLTKPQEENSKEKSTKTDYGVDESSNQGSRGVQRDKNVFQGRYSYGEEHEGTESPLHWEKEDGNLLKEMPEYSSKANTIESETEARHYTVLTSEKDSPVEVRPQVINIADADDQKSSRIGGFRTGTEAGQQPIENQEERATEIISPNPNAVRFNEQREDGKFMSVNEEMKQPNALDSTSSMVYPQTSNIVASNNLREPENELRNSMRDKKLVYENSAPPQPGTSQLADIHNVQPEHYNMLTSREESGMPKPQITNMVGSENDDHQDEDESRDLEENSQETTGDEVDGAFEVVESGETPTMRRNTDNPEDGVEEPTFINGDEYHLQKKYGITKQNATSHV